MFVKFLIEVTSKNPISANSNLVFDLKIVVFVSKVYTRYQITEFPVNEKWVYDKVMTCLAVIFKNWGLINRLVYYYLCFSQFLLTSNSL